MTFKQFNSQFRPLVDRAWLAQCELTGTAANARQAKDRWYREQLRAATDGKITSTKQIRDGADPDAGYNLLLAHFKAPAGPGPVEPVAGWTDAQNAWYARLARNAWHAARERGDTRTFAEWLDAQLDEVKTGYRKVRSRRGGFDRVMGHLAVVAGDIRAIGHFSQAAETRMRWQLERFLKDINYLTKTDHDWSYVQSIYKQSKQLPADINDVPVATLQKVLAMLDTHIRRLCHDYGIRPCELPNRSHPHTAPVTISRCFASTTEFLFA